MIDGQKDQVAEKIDDHRDVVLWDDRSLAGHEPTDFGGQL